MLYLKCYILNDSSSFLCFAVKVYAYVPTHILLWLFGGSLFEGSCCILALVIARIQYHLFYFIFKFYFALLEWVLS